MTAEWRQFVKPQKEESQLDFRQLLVYHTSLIDWHKYHDHVCVWRLPPHPVTYKQILTFAKGVADPTMRHPLQQSDSFRTLALFCESITEKPFREKEGMLVERVLLQLYPPKRKEEVDRWYNLLLNRHRGPTQHSIASRILQRAPFQGEVRRLCLYVAHIHRAKLKEAVTPTIKEELMANLHPNVVPSLDYLDHLDHTVWVTYRLERAFAKRIGEPYILNLIGQFVSKRAASSKQLGRKRKRLYAS